MKLTSFCRFVFFYGLLITLFSSCFTIKPVEFKKAENITTNRTDSALILTFELAMHNPNNWSLRLSEVETEITIDQRPLGKATLTQSVKLKKNSDFMLPVSAKASFQDLIGFSALGINLFLGKQSATAKINGNMVLRKFIFRKKVQFEYQEKIDSKMLQSLF